jgi:hypothetical protein
LPGQPAVEIVAFETDERFAPAVDHGMGNEIALDGCDGGERRGIEIAGAGDRDESGADFGIEHGGILIGIRYIFLSFPVTGISPGCAS